MKNFTTLFLLLASLVGASAHAVSDTDAAYLLDHMNATAAKTQLGTKLVLQSKRLVKAVLSTSGTGGSIGTHALGVTLPAKAIITKAFAFIPTQFGGSTGTVAIHCETANNIVPASVLGGGSVGLIAGASDGALANMKAITAACPVTATVGVADMVTGKMDIFVEYVVAE